MYDVLLCNSVSGGTLHVGFSVLTLINTTVSNRRGQLPVAGDPFWWDLPINPPRLPRNGMVAQIPYCPGPCRALRSVLGQHCGSLFRDINRPAARQMRQPRTEPPSISKPASQHLQPKEVHWDRIRRFHVRELPSHPSRSRKPAGGHSWTAECLACRAPKKPTYNPRWRIQKPAYKI